MSQVYERAESARNAVLQYEVERERREHRKKVNKDDAVAVVGMIAILAAYVAAVWAQSRKRPEIDVHLWHHNANA